MLSNPQDNQFNQRLNRRLTVSFVLVCIVPVAILLAVFLVRLRQQAFNQLFEQQELQLEIKESELSQLIDEEKVALETVLANNLDQRIIIDLLELERVSADLTFDIVIRSDVASVIQSNIEDISGIDLSEQILDRTNFTGLTINNAAGEVLVSTRRESPDSLLQTDLPTSITTTEVWIGVPPSAASEELSIFVLTPILDDEMIRVGTLVARLDDRAFRQAMATDNGTSTAQLITSDGVVITADLIGTVWPDNRFAAESAGIARYDNYRGDDVVGAWQWIPSMNATLTVEVPVSVATASINTTVVVSLVAAVIIAVVAATTGLYISNSITSPIRSLTEVTIKMLGGDYSQRANVTSKDEIGQLAAGFNQMTEQLANSIVQLEKRVNERTIDLVEARDRAERANQAKTEFLSNMSHELRTPLNMVIGYTSSMLKHPEMYNYIELPEIYENDIRTIQNSGRHLLSLINDVLDLSKIESGKLELHFEAVDMHEVFEGVMAIAIGLVNEKSVQIRSDYPSTIPHVWGDPTRIRQILLNLLSNAIKFTDTGSVTLHAEIRQNTVHIAIKDTGIGIEEEALEVIFDRFAQIQNGIDVKGTGLGLDISQRLAEGHGSRIYIESEMGIGSTFHFSLPIASQEQIDESSVLVDDIELPFNVTPQISHDAPAPQELLLISSDGNIRLNIREALKSENWVVINATEAQEGLEMATVLLPPLIMIDLDLPDLSIDNWLAQLNSEPETVGISVIAIAQDTAVIQQSISATLQKPVNPAELIHIVTTYDRIEE